MAKIILYLGSRIIIFISSVKRGGQLAIAKCVDPSLTNAKRYVTLVKDGH